MFESPILIYSRHCNYSKKFIAILKENPQIAQAFVSVNIDIDPETRQRPPVFFNIQNELGYKIAEVPTIIVEEGQYVLSGEEAFKWLEYELQKHAPEDLTAFNPNEMSSFSDNYSPFGESDINNASDQTFCFLSKNYDAIPTPPEDSIPRIKVDPNAKRESVNVNMSGPARMGHSDTFTRTNSNRNQKNKGGKKNEIDSRLEQLMMEREQLNPPQRRPQEIDFSTGRTK